MKNKQTNEIGQITNENFVIADAIALKLLPAKFYLLPLESGMMISNLQVNKIRISFIFPSYFGLKMGFLQLPYYCET